MNPTILPVGDLFADANDARPDLPPWPSRGDDVEIERRLLAHVAELDASRAELDASRAKLDAYAVALAEARKRLIFVLGVVVGRRVESHLEADIAIAESNRRAPVAPASLNRPSLSTLIATLFLVAMLFFGLVGFFATWGRP